MEDVRDFAANAGDKDDVSATADYVFDLAVITGDDDFVSSKKKC